MPTQAEFCVAQHCGHTGLGFVALNLTTGSDSQMLTFLEASAIPTVLGNPKP